MLALTKSFLRALPPNLITLSSQEAKTEAKHLRFLLKNLQHERLIHLLVMLTVGLATLLTTLFSLFNPILPLLILDAIFGTLFLAYIIHYFRLENTTQSCYPVLNNLLSVARKSPSD